MSPGRRGLSGPVRLLVRLATPARHRDDLERELADEVERVRRSAGRPAALAFLVRELAGVALHGLRDRWAGPTGDRGSRPGSPALDGLALDLRVSARRLARAPAFTAVATATLALALALTSSVFTLADAVLLRPLPYARPDRLVALWETERDGPAPTTTAPGNVRDWERDAGTLDGVAWFNGWAPTLTGAGDAVRVAGSVASVDLFDVLGVRPALGTGFLPEHAGVGEAPADRVVVLSHGLWVRQFGGEREVLGRTLELDDLPYRVVGVMPAGFRHPRTFLGIEPAELWAPLELGAGADARDQRYLHVVARLAEGATVAGVRAELTALAGALARAHPDANAGRGVVVRPVDEQVFGDQRPVLLLLLAAAGLVLLVACVNLANLLLARGLSRSREIAVRAALGSGRAALARQLLTEAGLLALLGGAVGLGLVLAGEGALRQLAGPWLNPLADVRVDLRVVAFTLAVAGGSGLLFGTLPALQLSRPDLRASLQSRSGSDGRTARGGLVAAETALTVVLLVGAGLLGRGLLRVVAAPPGFGVERTLLFELRPPRTGYDGAEEIGAFYQGLGRTLEAHPAFTAVGFLSDLPLTSENRSATFRLPASDRPDEEHAAEIHAVSPGFFTAAGIALLEGRDFAAADGTDAPPRAVVNRALARRHWGGASPLDAVLRFDGGPDVTVVGVVESTADDALGAPAEPRLYLSTLQWPSRVLWAWARTAGPAEDALGVVRPLVAEIDPRVPVAGLTTLERHVAASVATPRGTASLAVLFSALALLLAAVGIYGVLAHRVTERTAELGVRAALGARRGVLVRLVVTDSARVVGLGLAAGLAGAVVAGGVMAANLEGVPAFDPLVLAAAVAAVAVGTLAAAWIPARRASRVDPLVAMRAD